MLQIGNIYENYIEDPIKRELRLNKTQYIFNADVTITFDNNNYNYLSDDELKNCLAADISTVNEELTISELVVRASKTDGWPIVKLQNVVPMTLRDFVSAVSKIFLNDISVEEALNKYPNMFNVVKIIN